MRTNYNFRNLTLTVTVNGVCENVNCHYHNNSSGSKHKNITEYKDATASITLNGSVEGSVEARELLNTIKEVIKNQGIKKRG